jgi:hypothetical protein
MRTLKFMWKDTESIGGNCPALYEVEDGFVVQGKVLPAGETAQLRDLGDDEVAVFVPANVLDRLANRP